MAVFTVAKGGLMYEASIGGQKFSYTKKNRSGEAPRHGAMPGEVAGRDEGSHPLPDALLPVLA